MKHIINRIMGSGGALVGLLMLAGCTPAQKDFWINAHGQTAAEKHDEQMETIIHELERLEK